MMQVDKKLDKLLKKLQIDNPAVEGIKLKIQRMSDLVRYCHCQPYLRDALQL